MILYFLVAAALGLVLVVAFVRYGRFILRWGLRATAATAGFFLWLALGHYFPIIGYLGYAVPFALAAWFLSRRLARRFPALARLLERFPRRRRRKFEQAFKDEVGDDGKPSIPKVTGWQTFDA